MKHVNLIVLAIIAILFIFHWSNGIKEGYKPSKSSSKSSSSSNTPNIKEQAIADGIRAGSGQPKKPAMCFSKDTLLQMEDGSFIKICDAEIGQCVLSYSSNNGLTYSPIVSIPHERNEIYAEFVNIVTETRKNVKMTKCHLIPVSKANGPYELIAADKIDINDTIMTVDGEEKVVSKESCFDSGIYTVVTKADYIVTNNIIASPFAIFHMLPSMYYQIHKVIHNINPHILKTDTFLQINKQIINSVV